MKQVITKEDVSKAICDLTAQGKKTTIAAIHAALSYRGSMSTLVRLKTEIETAANTANDSAEGLKAFRAVWSAAVEEGRKEQEAKIAELRECLNSLATENERLDGVAMAAHNHANELEVEKSRAETELRQVKARVEAELDQARAAAAQVETRATDALQKLADSQAMHATQMAAMQTDRDNAANKAHDTELKLVRALAFLGARGNQMVGLS
jgi:predicted nuclease with TOPRIM domain